MKQAERSTAPVGTVLQITRNRALGIPCPRTVLGGKLQVRELQASRQLGLSKRPEPPSPYSKHATASAGGRGRTMPL